MSSNKRKVLLGINILACILLAFLAVFSPDAAEKGLLSYPAWLAPIVYMVVTLYLCSDKLVSTIHTVANLALLIFAAFLLVVTLPEATAETLKWWYPLGAGILLHYLVDLEKIVKQD